MHLLLTRKQLGIFFQNVILLPNIVTYNCNISEWNWSNVKNI